MKIYAVAVDAQELKKEKGSLLKNWPIPMPREELDRISEYCRKHGINRCEWARRVLLASFAQQAAEETA